MLPSEDASVVFASVAPSCYFARLFLPVRKRPHCLPLQKMPLRWMLPRMPSVASSLDASSGPFAPSCCLCFFLSCRFGFLLSSLSQSFASVVATSVFLSSCLCLLLSCCCSFLLCQFATSSKRCCHRTCHQNGKKVVFSFSSSTPPY